MKKSYALLHFSVFIAGFTGIFGRLISLNEGLLTWYRLLFSSLILFCVVKLFKTPTNISNKEKLDIAKVGLLITIHWIFFYASIKYANVSVGVVCYCLTSFFTAIFKPIVNKIKFKFLELLLSGFTLLGISLIFHFDTSYQLGIILGTISSAFAALYTIYNEKLVKQYDSKLINYYQMLGGTIGLGVLLPLYLYFFPVESVIPDGRNIVYLLFLSFFCTVILYISFAEVLKRIPAFTVNLSFNLEPLYAITFAFILFNEAREVNIYFYLGLGVVMFSVLLQSLVSIKKVHK